MPRGKRLPAMARTRLGARKASESSIAGRPDGEQAARLATRAHVALRVDEAPLH